MVMYSISSKLKSAFSTIGKTMADKLTSKLVGKSSRFRFCVNKQVDSTKYLGITFDSNLTWKSHINELCLKLSKTVGILSKVRHFVNKHILVMLYYSLIYPFLTYGIHVWGLTFPSFLTQLFTSYPKKSNQNNIFLRTKIPF